MPNDHPESTGGLLPCPFCGDAHVTIREIADGPVRPAEAICWNCGSTSDAYGNADEAIAAWNRRASTQVPGGGWQPIESAPKDGTYILACKEGMEDAHLVYWGGSRPPCWKTSFGASWTQDYTLWQPLPSPPTEGGT